MYGDIGLGTGISSASDIFDDLTSYDENEDILEDEELEDDESFEDDDEVEVEDEAEAEEVEEDDSEYDDAEYDDEAEVEPETEQYAPEEYVDVVKTLAGMQLGLFDENGDPAPPPEFMVDVAQNYENRLKYQKLENDILKLSVQDEDFNEVAPTFAQTVVEMPELLKYENGAEILYQIAKANYIQAILPEVVDEIVADRIKQKSAKQAFQSRKSAGTSSTKGETADIMDGIMAEAQRRAKLF